MTIAPRDHWFFENVLLLATRLPAPRPVKVHVRHRLGEGCYGITERDGRGFLVEIRRHSERFVMLDALAHEWGHVLTWNPGKDHANAWGVAYARAYRLIVEEDKP